MGSCIVIVLLFAVLQYAVIQKISFNPTDYIIPLVVGALFGFLIARIRILDEKYLQEKEQVVQKNQEIHKYVGTIVHDLRSPVSAIFSLSELMLESENGVDSQGREYLDLIKSSSSSVLENIGLILDNALAESGSVSNHLEVGNPYFTINSTIDKHLILAINKSISIQRLIDKNLPTVEYDKDTLARIVSNLISNAIKFSPPNTQIKVYTELLAGRLNLVVEDQGLGMTEDDLSHLFEEFHTLSSKPTGGEESSGLGLSVANKLAQQMGGEIIAESDGKNKGTTFRVKLKPAES